MNTHPFLRAYLAGIFLPTLVLPILLTVFIVARIVIQVPVPIEQVMIFPMAIVPSLFGLWNMLYLASHTSVHHPIGLHGAVLPLLMAPIGALVATHLNVLEIGSHGVVWFQTCAVPYFLVAPGFLFAMAAYYLVWKYIVGNLNRVLGIA
ncbi:MAG: hypothetical protein ACLPY1_24245 [Terracidiphilus sp.]